MYNYKKYKPYKNIDLRDRQWPNNQRTEAPIWCSVDLRDGNQALVEPMKVDEKIAFFKMLVETGFKEIEIGFPSASQIEFDFLRTLVAQNLIPEDVTIQVLTQARTHLIERTFEALEGVKKGIVHIYNSTSTLQRDVVFNMSKAQIKQIAVEGAALVKRLSASFQGEIILEYSPESFTGTELPFALEICEAVIDVWNPSKDQKVIINLPSTVESSTPNIFADQIEWMHRNFTKRDHIILSVHTHNDRGTGVAAAELAMLAGADRVEGTLFGNGERTGNLDILNMALNLYSQGINPELDFSNMNKLVQIYERSTKLPVHPRHPYAGDLVFTAFSGSHQDAINKGMKAQKEREMPHWEVPYLPIDPKDLGKEYEALVRINSQSGKGGIAFIMETNYGYQMPKIMHKEFADIIQLVTEEKGEILPHIIYDIFTQEYLEREGPYEFEACRITSGVENPSMTHIDASYRFDERLIEFVGDGNGPLDALKNGILANTGLDATIIHYSQHALKEGSDSKSAAYIQLELTNKRAFGVGIDTNITLASIKAFFCAINRIIES